MAENLIHRNGIDLLVFATACRMLLEKDRGKYRNILLTGPANCGKTFILNPLNVVYKTFSNPASTIARFILYRYDFNYTQIIYFNYYS